MEETKNLVEQLYQPLAKRHPDRPLYWPLYTIKRKSTTNSLDVELIDWYGELPINRALEVCHELNNSEENITFNPKTKSNLFGKKYYYYPSIVRPEGL